MACGGQATYDGSEIFIECDGDWDCCQREQAQAKCKNYNTQVPLSPQGVLDAATKSLKNECCTDQWTTMQDDMNADPAAGAEKWATSPCMAEKLEEEWDQNGDNSRTGLGINLDHQVEVKLGGPPTASLKALDAKVNRFFGNRAKELANNVGTDITGVYLICPNDPPCTPPPNAKDYSAAPKGKKKRASLPQPAHGWSTPLQ
jgi:hypothetical protein